MIPKCQSFEIPFEPQVAPEQSGGAGAHSTTMLALGRANILVEEHVG